MIIRNYKTIYKFVGTHLVEQKVKTNWRQVIQGKSLTIQF